MSEGIERRYNRYINAAIAPKDYQHVARLAELMYGHKDELTQELEELARGVREGEYDTQTMMWRDDDNGSHSQRCNANKNLDGGSSSVLPDGGSNY